jgi:hypothetical protein
VSAPFVLIEDIVNDWTDRDVPWAINGLAYYGGVSLLSAPPKVGKSTLLASLAEARTNGKLWLERNTREGATLLLTEEGAFPVAHRWHRSTELSVLMHHAAVTAHTEWQDDPARAYIDRKSELFSFRTWVLDEVRNWLAGDRRALVIVDTLARWGGIVDENDASEVTKVVGLFTQLAQETGAAVILVHHARKGGGQHGEAIRGSGAVLATVDVAWELNRVREGSSDRRLDVRGRVMFDDSIPLAFDPATGEYSVRDDDGFPVADSWLEPVPHDGPGLTVEQLATVWNVVRTSAQKRATGLLQAGRLRRETEPGRRSRYRYWSVPIG